MLRLLFCGTNTTKSTSNLCLKLIRNTSTADQPSIENARPIPEKLNVTLCGKVHKTPFILDDGALWLNVATRNPNAASFSIHDVFLAKRKSDRMVDRLMEAENRQVHINGWISYYDFVTPSNEYGQVAQIKAQSLYLCDTMRDDNDGLFDVNDVKLIGRVTGEPRNIDNKTFLDVDTRYFDRTKQTYQHRRHTLNILDESLRSHANTFVLDTKVVVNGWIDSLAVDVLNGGRRKSVTIQPYIMFAIQDL